VVILGKTSESNPTASMLRRLVPTCIVCGTNLAGHSFVQIASTVANRENLPRVQELFDHVKQHRWTALRAFKEFEGSQNAVLVYAIGGSHECCTVVLIRDPVDLYEPSELYLRELLPAEEVASLGALVSAEDWEPFESAPRR
jgi:hypothetical protein